MNGEAPPPMDGPDCDEAIELNADRRSEEKEKTAFVEGIEKRVTTLKSLNERYWIESNAWNPVVGRKPLNLWHSLRTPPFDFDH